MITSCSPEPCGPFWPLFGPYTALTVLIYSALSGFILLSPFRPLLSYCIRQKHKPEPILSPLFVSPLFKWPSPITLKMQKLMSTYTLYGPFTYSWMVLSPVSLNTTPNLPFSPQPPTQPQASSLSADHPAYFQRPGHLPDHALQTLSITLCLQKKTNKQTYLCPHPSLPSILQSQMMSCPSSCLRLTLPNDLDPSPPTSSRTLLHKVYALGQVISSL